LVHCPIAISVAADGDSTGEAREFGHLFGCAKVMWFFLIVLLPFFLIFLSFFIFRIIVCVYSSLFWYLEWWLVWGFGYTLNSPFTHAFCSLHEWDPISGSELFRIRGDCVAVPQWMYFPSGHCENLN